MFYADELDAASYRAWLNDWAVGYVVLPHAPPDSYAQTEAALIRSGRLGSWLQPVWNDAYWTVFRVQDAVPLATAPPKCSGAGDADIVLTMPRPGTVTVRAAYSHWLYADGACLRASGPWIQLTASRPGTYRITSSYFPRTTAEHEVEVAAPSAGIRWRGSPCGRSGRGAEVGDDAVHVGQPISAVLNR
ncbi:hypothetical protein ACU686_14960 [Yinghuangia aomiensis]